MISRAPRPAHHLAVSRVVAAIPLIGIGAQHLLGMAPLEPILVGAGIPFSEPLGWIVPILEVLAGLALLIGGQARWGALISVVIMGVALYAHMVHDWADEPVILLPIVVFLGGLQVLWGGAGSFSADLAATDLRA